jgi:uncharacterized protein with GYD domain
MAERSKPGKSARKGPQQYYLVQFSYTSAAWDDLLKNPYKRDRVAAVKDLVGSLGGCIGKVEFPCDSAGLVREKFGAFGDHDVVVLLAFPNDQAAASFAMAIAAGGGVTSVKTTRILPWSDMMLAMGAASSSRAEYAPPGKGK